MDDLGGGEAREDLKTLISLVENKNLWATSIDWEWRTAEEVDGSIANLPLMRKWLERVRGSVLLEKPDSLTSHSASVKQPKGEAK